MFRSLLIVLALSSTCYAQHSHSYFGGGGRNNIIVAPGYGYGYGFGGGGYYGGRSYRTPTLTYTPTPPPTPQQEAAKAMGWQDTYLTTHGQTGGMQVMINPYVTQPGESEPLLKSVSTRRGINVDVRVPEVQYLVWNQDVKGNVTLYGIYTAKNLADYYAKKLGLQVYPLITNRK